MNSSLSAEEEHKFGKPFEILTDSESCYGILFAGNLEHMLKLVCSSLSSLNIEWKVFSKDFRLKCRTKHDSEFVSKGGQQFEAFLRKKFVKFYLQFQRVILLRFSTFV